MASCSVAKCKCTAFKPQKWASSKCHGCFHWDKEHQGNTPQTASYVAPPPAKVSSAPSTGILSGNAKTMAIWEWTDDATNWTPFLLSDIEKVEGGYQNAGQPGGEGFVEMGQMSWNSPSDSTRYRFDFLKMTQTNLSSKKQRGIRRRADVPCCPKKHEMIYNDNYRFVCGECGRTISKEGYYKCQVNNCFNRCLRCQGMKMVVKTFGSMSDWHEAFQRLSQAQLTRMTTDVSCSAELRKENMSIVWRSWADVGRSFESEDGANTTDLTFFAVAPKETRKIGSTPYSQLPATDDNFVNFPAIRTPNYFDEVDVLKNTDQLRFNAKNRSGMARVVTLSQFLQNIGTYIADLDLTTNWADSIDNTPLQLGSQFSVLPIPSGRADIGVAAFGQGNVNLHIIIGPGGDIGWAPETPDGQRIFFKSGDGRELKAISLVPEERVKVKKAFFRVEVHEESVAEEKERYVDVKNRLLHLQIEMDGIPALARTTVKRDEAKIWGDTKPLATGGKKGAVSSTPEKDGRAPSPQRASSPVRSSAPADRISIIESRSSVESGPDRISAVEGRAPESPRASGSGPQTASLALFGENGSEKRKKKLGGVSKDRKVSVKSEDSQARSKESEGGRAESKESKESVEVLRDLNEDASSEEAEPAAYEAEPERFEADEVQSSSAYQPVEEDFRQLELEDVQRSSADVEEASVDALLSDDDDNRADFGRSSSISPAPPGGPSLGPPPSPSFAFGAPPSPPGASAPPPPPAASSAPPAPKSFAMGRGGGPVPSRGGAPPPAARGAPAPRMMLQKSAKSGAPASACIMPSSTSSSSSSLRRSESESVPSTPTQAAPPQQQAQQQAPQQQAQQQERARSRKPQSAPVPVVSHSMKAAAPIVAAPEAEIETGLLLANVQVGDTLGPALPKDEVPFAPTTGRRAERKAGVAVRATWMYYGVAGDGGVDAERLRRFVKQMLFERREKMLAHGSLVSGFGSWGGPENAPIKLFGMRLTDACDAIAESMAAGVPFEPPSNKDIALPFITSNKPPLVHTVNTNTPAATTTTPPTAIPPVKGITETPVLPLREACQPLSGVVSGIEDAVSTALKRAPAAPGKATKEHTAAVYLYTMASAFYRDLNAALRNPDRSKLRPYYSYLRLLAEAMVLLPAPKSTVLWRGVGLDLEKDHAVGSDVTWWGVSSCTPKLAVANGFLGSRGPRTLFSVHSNTAVPIQELSAFKGEEEFILAPGTRLSVDAVQREPNGLVRVTLKELPPPRNVD